MPWMSLLWSVVLLEGIKREQETVVVMLPVTIWLPSDGAVASTETPIVHFHYHHCRALLITQTVEVSCLPAVSGGAIQEFACEVTSKALFDRFDEELKLGLVCDQCCFFERLRPRFLFLPLFFFPLSFFLSSLLFFLFLQDCLQSLLQLGYLSL